MRNSFYEYYGLSAKEFDKLWDDAIVVFDTNVLLSLYRLPLDARNEIIAVMKEFKDRLWLPFQVGYEFHEHRLIEANRPIDSLRCLIDRFDRFNDDIEKEFSRNPYIQNFKYIKDTLKSLRGRIEKKTKEWIEACPDIFRDDQVLSELTSLYENKVGNSYNETRLKEVYDIGEQRYANNIPPGYKDKGKEDGNRHRFGDLIIWFQVLEKAKQSNCDIIFVTDDEKEDWWEIYKGNIIGPRHELIIEFRNNTNNHLIGFYTTERFLSYVKKKNVVSVKQKTIEGVKSSELDLDYFLGKASKPGQFSMDSLYPKSLGLLGESQPDRFDDINKWYSYLSKDYLKNSLYEEYLSKLLKISSSDNTSNNENLKKSNDNLSSGDEESSNGEDGNCDINDNQTK